MMKRDLRFSRRNLLKTIGAGAALLPLLESDPADAACLVSGIKRLYILVWPNGMLSTISSWPGAAANAATMKLSPDFQSSLVGHEPDLLLLGGLDYKFIKDMPGSGERTGHACFPGMLTGVPYQTLSSSTSADIAGGVSIDRYIGKQLQMQGYKGLVSLNQGTFVKSTGHLSWDAANQVVLPDTNPYHVFSTNIQGNIPATTSMMTPAPVPTGTMMPAPPPVDNTKAIKTSILDYVLSDLTRFSNVVSTADKQAINAHLQYVRDIETQLQMTGVGTGTASTAGGVVTVGTGAAACNVPSMTPMLDPALTANADKITKLHMDLGIAAFASDLTRVIVMQIGDQGAGNLILTWLNYATGGPNPGDANTGDVNGLHAIAHRNVADKVKTDGWFMSQVAYMVAQMKSITDATGKSMLDSSVFVGMSNMRTGIHETTNVPTILAGSCGGYFKTGRSLALTNTPHTGLLVALCNAMGTPAPASMFGQAQYGGELTALKG